jgi:hypothetical protein
MPQIKFSGLVTAMKGKAGGSIFSQNKQGAYFRNNRWGGGRKSQRWDNAKIRLSFLSNQWRLLSAEQREAWQAAGADYPFQNKFKESYIPSGYQLFMSLNGHLYSQNLPLLSVPGENRPFPDDIQITGGTPDIPWVTGGTGATFPIAGNGLIKPCSQDEDCPFGFTCQNNGCLPNSTVGSPAYLAARDKVRANYYMFGDLECEDDQDCVDQGLSGGSADVACQNGRCVYVGDGLEYWERISYVLNIQNILYNKGDWGNELVGSQTQINGSFRFTLGPDTLRKLMTTRDEIIIVSSYAGFDKGTSIRLRPQDQQTTRVYITFALETSDTNSAAATFVWYQDFSTEQFKENCVLQFQTNIADTVENYMCLNASGFNYSQFEFYDNVYAGSIQSWGEPTSDNHNPLADWKTTGPWMGIVYGAGTYGLPTDIIYSDIRFYPSRYTEFKYALSGMLQGTESILILASGEAKPKCRFTPCTPNIEEGYVLNNGQIASDCDWIPGCSCKGGKCGPWKSTERAFSNLAPGGDTDIHLTAAVPIYNMKDDEGGLYEFGFDGYWINKMGGFFANNGATFVPLVETTIQGTTESGFQLVVSVTRAKGAGKTVRKTEFIQMTLLPADVNATWELWEFVKAAISSAPPGSEFYIGFSIVDTQTGQTSVTRPPRFKAGAELSSSVN